MIREAIRKVVEGSDLTEQEAVGAMTEIMDGEATPAQVASFITALRMKGETVEEITGFVKVMREKAVKVRPKSDTLLDTCGTGGDKLDTFNISTTATFVVVGAGVTVAKHGNRAASSTCGSADVLEALGANLNLDAERVATCIDTAGLGFMFAPAMHPAMKHAVGPRKEIGIRTVFNILGPMTNPAGAKRQIIGVFSPDLTETMAKVLGALGTERAMVFHGMAGLDEISTLGETRISELKDGVVSTYTAQARGRRAWQGRLRRSVSGNGWNRRQRSRAAGRPGRRKRTKARHRAAECRGGSRCRRTKPRTSKKASHSAAESIDSGAAMNALETFKSITQELG